MDVICTLALFSIIILWNFEMRKQITDFLEHKYFFLSGDTSICFELKDCTSLILKYS